jgi:hypothetical protein
MKTGRLLFVFLLAAFASTMSANIGQSLPDNKGTDFFLAFPQNVNAPTTPTHRMTLFMAAEEATTVQISGPMVVTTAFPIPASTVLEVFFDTTSLQVSPNGVSDKGIRVRSLDPRNPASVGAPIAVYGLNRRMGSAGAYMALPFDVLGREYRALSRPGTSQVTIVGTRPDTTVTITPHSTVSGVTTVSAPISIELDPLQTYILQDMTADLTGTLVTANHPIAVFSGNQVASVNGGSTDHMVEQLVPVSAWGNEFIVAPILPESSADVVRVLAHEADTAVALNGVLQTTLGAGQFYEFMQPPAAGSSIETSKPSLVAYYNRGDSPATDTFVMLVPPVAQFSRQYLFKTPGSPFTPPLGSNRLNIVVQEGGEAGLLLDGAALPADTVWTPVNGYRYARVSIAPATSHSLQHPEANVQFGAWVYGQAGGEGYGYAAGQLVDDHTPPAIFGVPGDRTIEATGPGGETVTWDAPTASDFGRGELEVRCTPASGSVFGLGTTNVECSATDPAGNATTGSFSVTVHDTMPPTLEVSGNSAHASGPAGALVPFTAGATDTVSQNVAVDCAPASGGMFPVGPNKLTLETPVVCTATDESSNAATAGFMVTVTNAAPVCSGATPSMSTIPYWRRGFVPISINGVTDPDGDRVRIRIVGIFQDEPVARRHGRVSFDGMGVGRRGVFLRAERSERGDGRAYHVRFTAADKIGASCSGEVVVGVPRRPGGSAVDGGALHDSTHPVTRGRGARGRWHRDGEEDD